MMRLLCKEHQIQIIQYPWAAGDSCCLDAQNDQTNSILVDESYRCYTESWAVGEGVEDNALSDYFGIH